MLGLYGRAGWRCLHAAVLAVAMCAGASGTTAADPGQVDIAYLPPKNPAHQPLYELLMTYTATTRFDPGVRIDFAVSSIF